MRADYGESDCRGSDEEMVEVRCILRVPGEPDRETVARMPAWAVPKKKGAK
jgi:hypothetical protein